MVINNRIYINWDEEEEEEEEGQPIQDKNIVAQKRDLSLSVSSIWAPLLIFYYTHFTARA